MSAWPLVPTPAAPPLLPFDIRYVLSMHQSKGAMQASEAKSLSEMPTEVQLQWGTLTLGCSERSFLVDRLGRRRRMFSSFGQPTRLITCANHANNVICS